MSTEYILWADGPLILSAVESSARLSIGIQDERRNDKPYYFSVECLDSDNVLEVIVKLLEATSYISEDSEQTITRLHKAIMQQSKSYLGSMLKNEVMHIIDSDSPLTDLENLAGRA